MKLKNIGGLANLRQAFIENTKNKLMQKCCITGKMGDDLKPAIVVITKPSGREMTINGMVHKSIKSGRKYKRGGKTIGAIKSVTRKNVKMDFITGSKLTTIAICKVG